MAKEQALVKTKKAAKPPRGSVARTREHSSGHKGISRVDAPKRHQYGWLVRVAWCGEMFSKMFSDSANGGKDAALRRALVHRNRLEKELGKPRTDRTVMLFHERNGTGVLGVHRILKQGAPVYEVTWNPEPNKVRRTSVSIRKYGEQEAFKRACAIRREKEKEVFGLRLSYV